MDIKGCMGCNACRYGKPCVQKDGFNELIPKIKEAYEFGKTIYEKE